MRGCSTRPPTSPFASPAKIARTSRTIPTLPATCAPSASRRPHDVKLCAASSSSSARPSSLLDAMPRTHPPTLITLARAALRDEDLVPRGTRVLVAVSGGADSMALLHVLGLLRAKLSFGLFAHGVDHGLRDEASAELDLAERLATSLDVPFARTCVSIAPGGNLQARARTARWDALRSAASHLQIDRIATGHHADDRAETMLMRILRGTRARGLAVLPARSGERIRPFSAHGGRTSTPTSPGTICLTPPTRRTVILGS